MRSKPITKVGLWAGGSPASKSEFKAGLKELHKLGYEIVYDRNNFQDATKSESSDRKYLAGKDQNKLNALKTLLRRKDISQIICVRGGYGSVRLLPYLKNLNQSESKKIIWGFSDMTSVQNYLYLTRGFSFVHSPMLTSNVFLKAQTAEREAFQTSSRRKGSDTLSFQLKLFSATPVKKIPTQAQILGGNLTCLATILPVLNHKFPSKPFYLFLEEVSEKAYRIDRMLTLLLQSGFLKNCRGIFLGYFTDCPQWQGCLRGFSNDSKIPVWSGLPAGHDRPNISIPLGVKIKVLAESKNFGSIRVVFPKPLLAG